MDISNCILSKYVNIRDAKVLFESRIQRSRSNARYTFQ